MTTKTKITIAATVILILGSIPFVVLYQNGTFGQPASSPQNSSGSSLKVAQSSASTSPARVASPVVATAPTNTPSTQASVAAQTHPVVNPRAPSPGLYPKRPNFNDLQTAVVGAQGQKGTAGAAGPNEVMLRIQYGNLIQKMQFTPAQAETFIKILSDQEQQKLAIDMQYQIDPQTLLSMRTMSSGQKQELLDQHDQQLEPLLKVVDQNAMAQLTSLLGSGDNVDYYNTYTDQTKERTIIAMGYAQSLETAGLPTLTVDQEEQVVNLVYQYRTALNGSSIGGSPIPPEQQAQILQQAGIFLTPDQVGILQQVMPSLAAPYHKSGFGG